MCSGGIGELTYNQRGHVNSINVAVCLCLCTPAATFTNAVVVQQPNLHVDG